MKFNVSCLVLAAALTSACGQSEPPPPPFNLTTDVKGLMADVVDPAADGIWGAVGTIIDLNGTVERAPQTEEEWMEVRHAAVTLSESGNLLMLGNRVPEGADRDEWLRLCRALIDVSRKAVQAADAKSKEQVFDVGAEIYAVCQNCHQKFSPDLQRVSE